MERERERERERRTVSTYPRRYRGLSRVQEIDSIMRASERAIGADQAGTTISVSVFPLPLPISRGITKHRSSGDNR